MKRKKIYYNEEKNVDELKKKTPRGTCRHTGTSWFRSPDGPLGPLADHLEAGKSEER